METMTDQRRSCGYQLSCIRSEDYFLSVAVHPTSEAQIGLNRSLRRTSGGLVPCSGPDLWWLDVCAGVLRPTDFGDRVNTKAGGTNG
jgi:hypothetical protein